MANLRVTSYCEKFQYYNATKQTSGPTIFNCFSLFSEADFTSIIGPLL